jgi:hypothetical protein
VRGGEARPRSFASRSRNRGNVARVQHGEITVAFCFAEKFGEAFDDALVTRVRELLRFNRLRVQPRLAPRRNRSTRQRFDVGGSEHIADTLRDDFPRGIHAQFPVARRRFESPPSAVELLALLPLLLVNANLRVVPRLVIPAAI